MTGLAKLQCSRLLDWNSKRRCDAEKVPFRLTRLLIRWKVSFRLKSHLIGWNVRWKVPFWLKSHLIGWNVTLQYTLKSLFSAEKSCFRQKSAFSGWKVTFSAENSRFRLKSHLFGCKVTFSAENSPFRLKSHLFGWKVIFPAENSPFRLKSHLFGSKSQLFSTEQPAFQCRPFQIIRENSPNRTNWTIGFINNRKASVCFLYAKLQNLQKYNFGGKRLCIKQVQLQYLL